MNVGSLFSGVGLLDYGLHLAGWEHSWFVEREADRRSILGLRWPGLPVHDDVRAVGAGVLGRVDMVVGGFPCKGASTAGARTGFGHPETALWREQIRLIGELRPRYALVENVANILGLHGGDVWGEVLGDLDSLGYDVWWDCFPAAAFGAPHGRDRVFAVAADPGGQRRQQVAGRAPGDEAPDAGRGAQHHHQPPSAVEGLGVDWAEYEPAVRRWEQALGRPAPFPLVRRVDDGRTRRVERSRLSALGDGVLVQAGQLLGGLILDHAQGRVAA